MAASSANKELEQPKSVSDGKSLKRMRNNKGEITDPWGEPFSRLTTLDKISPTLTCIVRSERKERIKKYIFLEIPSFRNLKRRPSFQTKSKHFSRSIKTASTDSRCPIALLTESYKRMIWSRQLRPLRKPD